MAVINGHGRQIRSVQSGARASVTVKEREPELTTREPFAIAVLALQQIRAMPFSWRANRRAKRALVDCVKARMGTPVPIFLNKRCPQWLIYAMWISTALNLCAAFVNWWLWL